MKELEISFENFPKVVAHIVNQIEEIKTMLENSQSKETEESSVKKPIGIDEACKILGKAKPTIYALVNKREIPYYKNGKKLYFFEEELVDWITQGHRKTTAELEQEAELFIQERKAKRFR